MVSATKKIVEKEFTNKINRLEKNFLGRIKDNIEMAIGADATNSNITNYPLDKTFDSMSEDKEEVKMITSTQSIYPQETLLVDFSKKKYELIELVGAMLLCHEKPSTGNGNAKQIEFLEIRE